VLVCGVGVGVWCVDVWCRCGCGITGVGVVCGCGCGITQNRLREIGNEKKSCIQPKNIYMFKKKCEID